MEYLDLSIHDPESYAGKLVKWNGVEYEVGAHLGTGLEHITHKLINRKSRLCLHVLKVWRTPDLGYVPSEVRARLASSGEEPNFAEVIPISIEIQLPGGRGEMQVYCGCPDENAATGHLAAEGGRLMAASGFTEAIGVYQKLLKVNGSHTLALINLAAAHARIGNPSEAWNCACAARNVEPNYLLYRQACIQYLAAQNLMRAALGEFMEVQKHFPNVHDADDLAVRLYIHCGDPDRAVQCAGSCTLTKTTKDQIIQEAVKAMEARSQAHPLIDRARDAVKRKLPPDMVATLLREAHTIDSADPLLTANLGLAEARTGNHKEALRLLLRAWGCVPPNLAKTCMANAAFCAIESHEGDPAILLDITMRDLTQATGGHGPSNLAADLPGIGLWLEPRLILEEQLTSAARLVTRFAQNSSRPVPAEARRLVSLYEKALHLDENGLLYADSPRKTLWDYLQFWRR